MWVRAAMFATIIVLVVMILITPSLQGHPTELGSLPILILAYAPKTSTVIASVNGAAQAYLYESINLTVRSLPGNNTTIAWYEANDSYVAQLKVPANATPLYVHTRLKDRGGNLFELNVTMNLTVDASLKPIMVFTFPTDRDTADVTVTPPSDFRWPVPRRGMIP